MTTALNPNQTTPSPFDLDNEDLYKAWRDVKLESHPTSLGDLVVEIDDPRKLTPPELAAIMERLRKANMAVYVGNTGDDPDRGIPHAIARQLDLRRINHNWLADDDGLTSLTVIDEGTRNHYIPYTDKLIQWHTDGYYNKAEEQIHALNLHCVCPAAEGGVNRLMDHEIAYIMVRDADPDYIRALMAPDAMTIPARIEAGGIVARREEAGPVFSTDAATGALHMRYTIRKHNVFWKDDLLTQAALTCLGNILEGDTPFILQGRLEPGMGLISNNVLHDRSAFSDDTDHKRLLYRARYFDRIPGTGITDVYPELVG